MSTPSSNRGFIRPKARSITPSPEVVGPQEESSILAWVMEVAMAVVIMATMSIVPLYQVPPILSVDKIPPLY
jgi:hypothetical protein